MKWFYLTVLLCMLSIHTRAQAIKDGTYILSSLNGSTETFVFRRDSFQHVIELPSGQKYTGHGSYQVLRNELMLDYAIDDCSIIATPSQESNFIGIHLNVQSVGIPVAILAKDRDITFTGKSNEQGFFSIEVSQTVATQHQYYWLSISSPLAGHVPVEIPLEKYFGQSLTIDCKLRPYNNESPIRSSQAKYQIQAKRANRLVLNSSEGKKVLVLQ